MLLVGTSMGSSEEPWSPGLQQSVALVVGEVVAPAASRGDDRTGERCDRDGAPLALFERRESDPLPRSHLSRLAELVGFVDWEERDVDVSCGSTPAVLYDEVETVLVVMVLVLALAVAERHHHVCVLEPRRLGWRGATSRPPRSGRAVEPHHERGSTYELIHRIFPSPAIPRRWAHLIEP